MKVALVHFAVAAVVTAGLASEAEAKTSKREGLNFGTTVRMLDTSDRSNPTDDSLRAAKTTTSGQSISPYIGYAFGSFNLGLMYSMETQSTDATETSADGMRTSIRHTDEEARGGSIFARFLFANVFFFEAAGGIYEDTLKVHTEQKQSEDGSAFNGTEDDYELKGIGPGYHVAGGLELPISNGFFFTAAYQARIVQLRDHVSTSSLGKKRSQTQKREALFGIAYYDK